VAIVKLLIPRIDKGKKLSSYKNRGTCIDWLMTNTTWETELENAQEELIDGTKEIIATAPKLFDWVPPPPVEGTAGEC